MGWSEDGGGVEWLVWTDEWGTEVCVCVMGDELEWLVQAGG